jgi:hypothetical protein
VAHPNEPLAYDDERIVVLDDWLQGARACFSNGISGGSSVLGGREPVAEGDGEGVEDGLPAHCPSGLAVSGRVEGSGDQIQAL